jgi:phosphoribosylaminoimidazole-succinocarboxamide synthase
MMKQTVQSLLEDSAAKVARTARGELICERHGKHLYHSEKPEFAIQEFAANGTEEGKKRSRPKEIDGLRNEISAYLFEYLDGFHIPTHFVNLLSETQMLVRRMEIIPIVTKIYNTGSSALAKRFGMKEALKIEFPIIEHYYWNNDRAVSWVNEHHAYAFGLATAEEFKQMNRTASKVNAVLRGLCDRRQLMLADLQLEFGRSKGQIVLGDELSPSTCHFVDLAVEDRNGRDRFLPDQENAVLAYAELRDRLKVRA